ncbi:MAG TPA: 30S ribosomal protein S6 [Kiloniellales bacterium]|nr:30S ribosomal protein S6 [Kiloniellales bacterium]
MALYECVFIARQDISATQAEALADQFSEVITQGGGEVAKKELWGLRNLAYRIKKNRKGHYVLLNLDAPPPAVGEMERQMRLHDDVLRYLTVRVPKLEEGPSAILQSRHGRDDRGRGGRGGPRDRDGRPPRGGRSGGREGNRDGGKESAEGAKAASSDEQEKTS